ncbi:bacteriorhodopsin [Xylaria flabelliformis]|nr:bacteriorhodopsin [Xylaria flabelliformis]
MSGNQAINANRYVGQQANLQITHRGSDWYYTVCAMMGATTLIAMGLAFRRPQTHRLFHYLTAAITAVACVSYFAMGSNLGQLPILVEFVRRRNRQVGAAGTREIFYARYIDWFITTPLLLLELLLTAGVPTPTILVTLFADALMIVCGLIGALTQTRYKWGFWTFGMAALFFIAYELLYDARRHANVLGGDPKKTFWTCGIWLLLLWFLYPIAWGLSEGGNVIHPDSEAIFYGVLDVLAKIGFAGLLLWGHRKTSPRNIGRNIIEPDQLFEKHGQDDGVTSQSGGAPSNISGSTAGAGHPTATPTQV